MLKALSCCMWGKSGKKLYRAPRGGGGGAGSERTRNTEPVGLRCGALSNQGQGLSAGDIGLAEQEEVKQMAEEKGMFVCGMYVCGVVCVFVYVCVNV